MKIMFIAAEGAPFAKTGGLGDVIGALPKSLVKKNQEVAVVLPYYDMVDDKFGQEMEELFYYYVDLGWRHQYVGVKKLVKDGISFYFIDNHYYFFRGRVYGDWDDGERFAFFQVAAIELMEKIAFIPDVLHLHDYHTAMIPYLLKEKYSWIQAYQNIKTVFTIHNIEFQGQYNHEMLGDLFGMSEDRFWDGTLRWNNQLNWMKGAVLYSDRVTTVSPSYAHEIQTEAFGKGLDAVMRMESGKLVGIINGIDTDLFDPETDSMVPYNFSKEDLSGKVKDKQALQERVGLPIREDVLLVGIVSRLTDQKGFDLVVDELHHMLQEDIQIVVLGTGYPEYEQAFKHFADHYPKKMSSYMTFDLELAQQIYAACDLFLMPSAFEPCGLSQMMAMRYGTLPLVHEVGGLKDTVQPYNEIDKTGTGFSFHQFSGYWLIQTLSYALDVYQNHKKDWKKLQENAMSRDFSWDTASQDYLNLYQKL